MKDVFVSHSSVDIVYARQFCEKLESYGFSCWASFNYADVGAGDDYMERISSAIKSVSVFIVLISPNALTSHNVKNEVGIANNQVPHGLVILGVFVNDEIGVDTLNNGLDYVFSRNQTGKGSNPEYFECVIKRIEKRLAPVQPDAHDEIVSADPKVDFFAGRAEDVRSIKNLLEETGRVSLYGIPGIGKTTVARRIARELIDEGRYKNVLFISYSRNFIYSIADDENIRIHSTNTDMMRKQGAYTYAQYKLNLIENEAANASTLIIIDDLETDEDHLFNRIMKLPCDLIICSVNPNMSKRTNSAYKLAGIRGGDAARSVFEKHYGRELSEEEFYKAIPFFESVRNHPLTLALLGAQMRYNCYSPSEFFSDGGNANTCIAKQMAMIKHTQMYETLCSLFDVRSLQYNELCVIKTMCLTPDAGIEGGMLDELTGNEYSNEIQVLIRRGWIMHDDLGKSLAIHPIAREIVINESGVDLDDNDIRAFVTGLFAAIKDPWNRKDPETLYKYRDLALEFYNHFAMPTIERFSQYILLARYMWAVGCSKTGIEILENLKKLFALSNGKYDNSGQSAEAFFQIGLFYHTIGDYAKALENQETARMLFSDRYAATLSHYALGMMMQDENNDFGLVEPLLRESLALRERYGKGTIKEAVGYHQFAKALCEYQQNLDEALKLERVAERFFDKNQPGTRNDSSAKYLLGWIYVQKAEDDREMLAHGIEYLEKGKAIRLSYVDEFHEWMEDVYRKLAEAYRLYGDNDTAIVYYEKLLKVAQKKHPNDKSNPVILEAYRSLAELYEQVQDMQNAAEARRYIKYNG